MIDFQQMSNIKKVAALLIVLGPNTASEILKNISDDDIIEQITIEIANLNKVPPEVLDEVLEEFYSLFRASSYLSIGGMTYAETLLESVYGPERSQFILNKLLASMHSNPFEFFNNADPAQLASSFQNENPQLIALILAYLKPDKAAQVMNALPHKIQAAVSIKIAEMDRTNPEILSDVEKIVEQKFSSVVTQDFFKAGGVEALANIINRSDRPTEKLIIETLEYQSPELAEQVRELMFVFEDIILLDDRSVQRVLREIDSRELALALKGANDEVKDKVFKNMSERASEMLKDDMQYMGPVRTKEVQEAQTKIVAVLRALESSGEIVIMRAGAEDEFIV